MNHQEQGHSITTAGGLLFAAILGCLTVLSACPPEKAHDTAEEIKHPAGTSVEESTHV
ncbi:hypothetical protein [Caballeronia sp. SBC1]|uniref:hypothetical protein n=1 Tax=Caballeronia sp. SBC1 TaxID=2705548 RepID=UPI00140B9043|nr:hypothetical protein [Caballeronia sp. SBC1]